MADTSAVPNADEPMFASTPMQLIPEPLLSVSADRQRIATSQFNRLTTQINLLPAFVLVCCQSSDTTVIERVGVDLLSKFTVLSPSTILTSLLSTAEPS